MEHFIYPQDDETPIWRVFRQEHLINWLDEERLYFPRPQNWDDRFENFLLGQQYHIAGTNIQFEFSSLLDRYFGQCWTRRADETDATWRIFAPNKNGVRVKTTVGKLYRAMRRHSSHEIGDLFICRVDYFSKKEICKRARLAMEWPEAFFEETEEEDPGLIFLTMKRPEFKHEVEVRVIYRVPKGEATSQRFLLVPCSPLVIEEIVIDPRTDAVAVENFVAAVRSRLPDVQTYQSDLYRIPDLSIAVYGNSADLVYWSEFLSTRSTRSRRWSQSEARP